MLTVWSLTLLAVVVESLLKRHFQTAKLRKQCVVLRIDCGSSLACVGKHRYACRGDSTC
ncbi:hypothetical protein PZA11_001980 [Diplocarpon coronariae]